MRVASPRPAARLLGVLLVGSFACSSPPKKPDGEPKADGDRNDAKQEPDLDDDRARKPPPKAIDPCGPSSLGLGAARPVMPWAAPKDCTAISAGADKAILTTEEEFARRFRCPAGVTSGIDFDAHQLVVEDRSLSPAGAGTTIVDDGAKVTFIERFRSPCPGDPQAMPITYTLGFLLPKGEKRQFATTGCTLPPSCG